MKDKIFLNSKVPMPFNFNEKVAKVFDDMLVRSVPFYNEIQQMVLNITNEFIKDNTNVYDLGCSTGNTLLNLMKNVGAKNVKYIGVDFSRSMLKRVDKKLCKLKVYPKFKLKLLDLNKGIRIKNASVVISILTMQFIKPLKRNSLIEDIYSGLNENGCFIMVEKVLSNDMQYNEMFRKFYYGFKEKQGYSKLEISRKRDALENVLLPHTHNDNLKLLKKNNFNSIDIFFKWFNFYGIIAKKLR